MLEHRQLGSTDLKVSPLGLGTVKFGRNTNVKYPNNFELPDDKTIINILNILQDNNINLLDTAPAYGISEERIGKLLTNRPNWVLSSKVGEDYINNNSIFNYSPENIIKSVERSLTRLKTDYLDLMLIHSDGNDIDIIEKYSVFYTLENLKKQGKIRYYGMSTKTCEGGIKALELSDVVMACYTPDYLDEQAVLDKAIELKKGVFIKKALQSGHAALSNFDFIYKHGGVSSIIIGSITPAHILENIAIARKII